MILVAAAGPGGESAEALGYVTLTISEGVGTRYGRSNHVERDCVNRIPRMLAIANKHPSTKIIHNVSFMDVQISKGIPVSTVHQTQLPPSHKPTKSKPKKKRKKQPPQKSPPQSYLLRNRLVGLTNCRFQASCTIQRKMMSDHPAKEPRLTKSFIHIENLPHLHLTQTILRH